MNAQLHVVHSDAQAIQMMPKKKTRCSATLMADDRELESHAASISEGFFLLSSLHHEKKSVQNSMHFQRVIKSRR